MICRQCLICFVCCYVSTVDRIWQTYINISFNNIIRSYFLYHIRHFYGIENFMLYKQYNYYWFIWISLLFSTHHSSKWWWWWWCHTSNATAISKTKKRSALILFEWIKDEYIYRTSLASIKIEKFPLTIRVTLILVISLLCHSARLSLPLSLVSFASFLHLCLRSFDQHIYKFVNYSINICSIDMRAADRTKQVLNKKWVEWKWWIWNWPKPTWQ